MKKSTVTGILFLAVGILILSCNAKKVSLTDPSQSLIDSISLMAMNDIGDSAINDVSRTESRGLQWKAWESWFKECPENKTFKKDIVYLGASSSKGIGYIMSKDKSLNRWDFFKINQDTSVLKTFLDPGVDVAQCDLSKMTNFSFDMMADGNVLKTINADLGALISNAKNITVKSGTWRIESMDTGPFMEYINSSNDPMIQKYRDALLDDGNVVLTKVLKISGFEAEIESKDTINAGLKATLENGFNVNVLPVDSTHKIGFNLNFKKTSDKIVKVSSTGILSLFGQASKGKELK
jgi:hypothetical protein